VALVFLASAAGVVYSARSMSGGAGAAGAAMPGGWTLSMMWLRMPGQTWAGGAAAFLATWIVMMVAMMLPPLTPQLATFPRRGLAALAGAGYFSVWALFGGAVYVLGAAIAAAELRWPAVARQAPLATGLVLVAAGWLQLTGWKADRLARCRACVAPASPDAARALRHGFQFGVLCSACCAGLMAVLLVAGMMHLAVVAALAAVIALERLAPRPERTARATGVFVIVIGVFAIARALVA
jgi:predicted metal-binding membrane protein